ncbi:PAQR family membrane homeostasis protein TrhA [Uliginosibacterium aquaticum]|uniref:Hemolysin III family protein n=1 Tax=Uliginosibacterium aquaticum TaxID=2731212 RepID=A0ABX2IQX5_9RHOO|nr:hemolysin III family protein [Uliginosibacterium aquaticum]NSL56696.1 hemolysin III family protein [Uliginosibacterium aquaticum]
MEHMRPQSRGEEFANWASHSLGLLAALSAFPILVILTARHGSAMNIAAASIYASTLVLMFASSTLYHMVRPGRIKQILRKLDHASIYLLIAGTYTPFTFSVLAGPWGWTLFSVIWALAALGLYLKLSERMTKEWISMGLYLLMGWLVIVAAVPLFQNLSAAGTVWLIAGGLAYTGGVVFYALDGKLRYGHFVWHLFVLAGTICHFFAVLYGCTPEAAVA